MFKILGLILFSSIAIFSMWFGMAYDEPVGWQMGIALLVIIAFTVLCVKLFPKHLDSKESGEEGMKFLKHLTKRTARFSDDD